MNAEKHTFLTQEQQKQLVAFAKEQFTFLKTERGFSRPLVNQPSNGLLLYRNSTIGIRLQLTFSHSYYERDSMQILLGKLDGNGAFPKFPYTDQVGVRRVWALQSFFIRQLHIQDEHISAIDELVGVGRREKHVWTFERWKQVISSYRALLHKYIDLVLQQPPEVLFPTDIGYLFARSEDFARFAREHFSFLREFGFQPDPIIGYAGSSTWINADRGIELSQDARDRDISCCLLRLIDGKIPTYSPHDLERAEFTQRSSGDAISLSAFLSRHLGITDADLDILRDLYRSLPVRDFSDYDSTYASTVIRTSANLVKRSISQILRAPL